MRITITPQDGTEQRFIADRLELNEDAKQLSLRKVGSTPTHIDLEPGDTITININ